MSWVLAGHFANISKDLKKAQTLSIVIPVYNEQRYLRRCLESIAAQTVMPSEVIVVDNNSTDDSEAIAEGFAFVKMVRESIRGIVHARNAGFNAAKSKIIARIDADTCLPEDWVEKILNYYQQANNSNSAITGGCWFYNIPFGRFYGWMQSNVAYRANRLIMSHYITWGSNMAFPRKMWQTVKAKTCNVGGIHEDLDLAIHLNKLGYKIHYDQNLKVGVEARRVFTRKAETLPNLMMWPDTLKYHHNKRWIFGWLGAAIIFANPFLRIHRFIAVNFLNWPKSPDYYWNKSHKNRKFQLQIEPIPEE